MSDSAIHAIAGSVGGCISMAMTYPLVTLSTRAAVKIKENEKEKDHIESESELVERLVKGRSLPPGWSIIKAIGKTIKEEGVAGLYSGLESSLFGIAVTNGIYYAFYEETRSVLLKRRTKTISSTSALTTSEGIIAGLIAGSITTILTNPIWTVQAHQTTRSVAIGKESDRRKIKPSAMSSARTIMKEDGLKGFWRGLGPALILVINPVIQYTTYERMVSALLNYRLARAGTTPVGKRGGPGIGRSSLSDWDLFVLGALSKLIATGGTYPYLVVKSRLQAATHKYKSSVKAVLHILQTEGLQGLYAGLGPKLLQSALTAAFMFVAQRRIYETVKKMILLAAEKKGAVARV